MKQRAWWLYLSVTSVILTAFVFVHAIRVGPLFNAIGLSAAVAIVIAMRMNHPRQILPWVLIAIGQVLFVAGDVITYNYQRFFGVEAPFPSIGDALYLSVYPFIVAGLLLLIRRRTPGRDRSSLIDSLIIAVGVGSLSWVLLIAPNLHDASLGLQQKITAMSYPMMDLILFSVAVRLFVGAGKRPVAFYLMIASVLVLFMTDSIYAWITLHGTYDNGTGLLEWGWGYFYLLLGAAALHPSMVDLDEPTPPKESKNPRLRLLVLAGASLTAPFTMLYLSLRGEPFDATVLVGCTIFVFLLVLVRLRGLMVDIDEHRRTERQLRETEAKYRSLVEGLPAVVYTAEFGQEGRWTYISPRIEDVLGFPPDEWIEQTNLWRERILPEDRDAALDAELRLISGEGRMACEYRIVGKDGRVIWIREEADAITDEGGEAVFLQGVMYDVTEQKRAEERLRAALDTEKEAGARLRSLHEMQQSFMQAVSHDLRTPLTSILGCALTLANAQGSLSQEDSQDLVERIAANARKLHRLLTNLLDLDRMGRGIVEPQRDRVDVTRVIQTVIDEISHETHPVEWTNRKSVIANVDPAQVERIVENLVTNAIRYTPEGTTIWVGAIGGDEGVLLLVEDTGPGIPAELRESIFEPFEQGDQHVKHSPGVGIGLSLVSRFAQLHGGRAWVEEREGGGASFKVFLPSTTDAGAQSEPVTNGVPALGAGTTDGEAVGDPVEA